jgi:tRNA(Ile)-lysidine synthase TilS/MesJ
MILRDEINVAKKAYEKGIRKVTIGFSTGKDSVVGLDMLLKAGIEPIPIYFYCVPGLKFIENNLKMYEEHFGIKIGQLNFQFLIFAPICTRSIFIVILCPLLSHNTLIIHGTIKN